jgi:RNA polymerase sigma-70 factor, ECF subfamily
LAEVAKDHTDHEGFEIVISGMPLEAVAERMGTNRNTLYKLLHDARKRLKQRMATEGPSP